MTAITNQVKILHKDMSEHYFSESINSKSLVLEAEL